MPPTTTSAIILDSDMSEFDSDDDSTYSAASTSGKRTYDAMGRGDTSHEEDIARKGHKAKRGRGRPPTTGVYVGLAKAKAELNRALREETALRDQADLQQEAEEARRLRAACRSSGGGDRDESASGLRKTAEADIAAIRSVAKKSRNLKGTSQRMLNEAAASYEELAEKLLGRTSSDENRLLGLENERFREKIRSQREVIVELRARVEKLEGAFAAQRLGETVPAPPPSGTEWMEELKSSIMVSLGTMMDAKLANLESRLPPEKPVRPPLQSSREASVAPSRGAKKASRKAPEPPAIGPDGPGPGPTETATASGETPWSEVVRRKKTKKKRVAPATKTAATAEKTAPTSTNRGSKEKKKKKKKRTPRPPRSAAVAIKLLPEAEAEGMSYMRILSVAKEKIDLRSLGITEGIRLAQAATGARILELPGAGAENEERADRLAAMLREVLPRGAARIDRPVKRMAIRLFGLDDTITKDDVRAAVARDGGCPADLIEVGDIRADVIGTGVVRVSCPVAAANKIAANRRLLVGWSSVRVVPLGLRPMRCYRCMEVGHAAARCSSQTDRSSCCFRCGLSGHRATECRAEPHCVLCAADGLKAEHSVGAKTCAHAKKSRGKARRRPGESGFRGGSAVS